MAHRETTTRTTTRLMSMKSSSSFVSSSHLGLVLLSHLMSLLVEQTSTKGRSLTHGWQLWNSMVPGKIMSWSTLFLLVAISASTFIDAKYVALSLDNDSGSMEAHELQSGESIQFSDSRNLIPILLQQSLTYPRPASNDSLMDLQ